MYVNCAMRVLYQTLKTFLISRAITYGWTFGCSELKTRSDTHDYQFYFMYKVAAGQGTCQGQPWPIRFSLCLG
jgi:hypothetical protein